MFRTDQPIRKFTEDTLERASYARAISDAMLSYKSEDSLTVGLYGKWGHGKTSVINLVVEHLEEQTKSLANDEMSIVFRFNPWNFSGVDQLFKQFFKQLSSELGREDHGEEAKKAGKLLKTYSKLISPLALVPQLAPFVKVISEVLGKVGDAATSTGEQLDKSLNAVKDELNKLLAKLNRKIIIIIDDIDRLNNNEIRQIFQLVKSVGDFANTIYFLSFDKDVVIEALKEVQKGDGLEYLEKVVQVPFILPTVSHGNVEKLLFNEIDELFGNTFADRFDQGYWSSVYLDGLKFFFENIRDVNRFLNVLRFEFNLLKEEVNPVDLLAITALKVLFPDFHKFIGENKDVFTGVFSDSYSSGSGDRKKEEIKTLVEGGLSGITPDKLKYVKKLVELLFPKFCAIWRNNHYHHDFLRAWQSEFRVCTVENFDIYFRLSIPSGDISRGQMKAYLSEAQSKEQFGLLLLDLIENGKVIRFLERLEDYTEKDIPPESFEPVISAIVNLGDHFPKDNSGLFGLGARLRLQRLIRQLLKRLPSQDERFELIKSVVENATSSICTPARVVSIQGQNHGENVEEGKYTTPEEERYISSSHLVQLKQIMVRKIKEWNNEHGLVNHDDFIYLIFRWKDWGSEDEVQKYIQKLISDDKMLVKFLVQSLTEVSTSTPPYTYWQLGMGSIEPFFSPESVIDRVRAIQESDYFSELEEKEKLGVRYFIKAVDEGKAETSDYEW